jgi:hypothetical protein
MPNAVISAFVTAVTPLIWLVLSVENLYNPLVLLAPLPAGWV